MVQVSRRYAFPCFVHHFAHVTRHPPHACPQARAFLTWADASSPGWVEGHVEAMVNIAGTSLGVPKAVSALLSGGSVAHVGSRDNR